MFINLPTELNTSKFSTSSSYWGRRVDARIAHQTKFHTREAMIIREKLETNKPFFITIGETNIKVEGNKLITKGISLIKLSGTYYSDTNRNRPIAFWMARMWTHSDLTKHISGIVKYMPGLSLRPIYLIKGTTVNMATDILDIVGFQIISRDLKSHFNLEPIFVNEIEGVEYT